MIRKVITLVLLSCFVFSESSENISAQENSKLNISNDGSASPKPKGPAYTNSRNSYFSYFLVDSSKNGYGGFLETNSPLAYSYDETDDGENAGWVAVYRQAPTPCTSSSCPETAGFLGVAKSDAYQENWVVSTRINTAYPEGQTYQYTPDGSGANLPTPDGAPGARYPSATISSYYNKPTPVWNEYAGAAYGGGDYGGVPMYTFDFFSTGNDLTNYQPIKHLNDGCGDGWGVGQTGSPCDPPDLWNGNVQMIDGYDDNGDPKAYLLAAYTSWAGTTYPRYMIRSLAVAGNGLIQAETPEYWQADTSDVDDSGNCVWYECTGYTGAPDFHVNREGTGYMAVTSYSANSDTEEPASHTLFFKKTEDYGQSWTEDEGLMNSGYHYISDAVLDELSDSLLTLWSSDPEQYPDKPWYPWATDSDGNVVGDTINFSDDDADFFYTKGLFLGYSYDVVTDNRGGLHFAASTGIYVCKNADGGCEDSDGFAGADSLYLRTDFPGAGMYHFYNPDPIEDPDNWTATMIQDFSDSWGADWGSNGTATAANNTLGSDAWFYFYPNIRPSHEEGSDVMWYAAANMSSAAYNVDSTLYEPRDIDIFMAKSVNLGLSWTEPENVTNTTGLKEVGVHLANIGSDYEVGVFCQVPNFAVPTAGTAQMEDYLNYVYIGKYENDLEHLSADQNDDKEVLPSRFALKQNYPNPFNPVTNISYSIEKSSNVTLKLYDVRGGLVQTLLSKRINAGSHDYTLDASNLPSGVYFYTMSVNNVSKTKKLILMK